MEATPIVSRPSTNQLTHMSVFCVLAGLLIHCSAFRSLVHVMMEGYIQFDKCARLSDQAVLIPIIVITPQKTKAVDLVSAE